MAIGAGRLNSTRVATLYNVTSKNQNRPLAIVPDDKDFWAPNINSPIRERGIIGATSPRPRSATW
jgi:preprotein translocase subunit SecD